MAIQLKQLIGLKTRLMSSQLRIAIFPYIPDLAGDKLAGLRQFIADEFKKKCGESVQVETKADPYDLKQLTSTSLANGEEAYDIMEVDTVLLGELAKSGCLQPLEGRFKVTEDVYTASAVHSVRYSPHFKQHLYGIPTLQCASFLMELADKDYNPKEPLLKEWKSFDELKKALDKAESETGPKVLLAGDFRGSWGLPMFYLDAYVDKHGKGSVYEGIDARLILNWLRSWRSTLTMEKHLAETILIPMGNFTMTMKRSSTKLSITNIS